MAFISSLKLSNFRCYEQAALGGLSGGLIVVTGPNGAGKTNILEAISLLSPGRGLRGARMGDIQRAAGNPAPAPLAPWAVAAELAASWGAIKIGTGFDPAGEKRTVRIAGETVKSQSALAEYCACVWLTPQMDRLFMESSRERRRFLDRLVFTFDPGHAGRVSRYDNAMGQRSRLLREGRADPAWITALEAQMAETGVAIAAARLDFVQRLQQACASSAPGQSYFPLPLLRAKGTVEELLLNVPALEVEGLFRYQLRESRGVDMLTGGAATGPHKSDMEVYYPAKNMYADQCSTGEQKALLIGVILAHAKLIASDRIVPPVLLLDEVAAHLDESRRAALYGILQDMGGQVWLTGTDISLFREAGEGASFLSVEDARISDLETPDFSVQNNAVA